MVVMMMVIIILIITCYFTKLENPDHYKAKNQNTGKTNYFWVVRRPHTHTHTQ